MNPTAVKRVPLSIKIAPPLREQLLAEAEKHGRTLTQEAEYRLRSSFDREAFIAAINETLNRRAEREHDSA